MVHEHSIRVHKEVVLPEIKGRKGAVYTAIKQLDRPTMREVAQHLGVPLNTISGRFIELQNDLKIKVDGVKNIECTSWAGKTYTRQANRYSVAA